MVVECLQDQLVSTGDPYNDDPVIEDQMECLSEYLLTKAQIYIEAERFHSAFELVWACIWHLEYGAGHVYPRKCRDKTPGPVKQKTSWLLLHQGCAVHGHRLSGPNNWTDGWMQSAMMQPLGLAIFLKTHFPSCKPCWLRSAREQARCSMITNFWCTAVYMANLNSSCIPCGLWSRCQVLCLGSVPLDMWCICYTAK